MLTSMTGYGCGTASRDGMSVTVEIRSVNNRYFDISAKIPKSLQTRELEVKELVRTKLNRGKITLHISVERENHDVIPVTINFEAARQYLGLLESLRKELGLKSEVSLDTLLGFSDVLTSKEENEESVEEWKLVQSALNDAMDQIHVMRRNEGQMIADDLRMRASILTTRIGEIESISGNRAQAELEKLRMRIEQLIQIEKIDSNRLEMEIALLADKMDITEECVRLKSHLKFFLDTLDEQESGGRKLNFLLQEMNREANTIGAKAYDAEVAHLVVAIKDEVERIREQIQNVE